MFSVESAPHAPVCYHPLKFRLIYFLIGRKSFDEENLGLGIVCLAYPGAFLLCFRRKPPQTTLVFDGSWLSKGLGELGYSQNYLPLWVMNYVTASNINV